MLRVPGRSKRCLALYDGMGKVIDHLRGIEYCDSRIWAIRLKSRKRDKVFGRKWRLIKRARTPPAPNKRERGYSIPS